MKMIVGSRTVEVSKCGSSSVALEISDSAGRKMVTMSKIETKALSVALNELAK